MDIFVEKDGQRLGPFSIAQLGQSLAESEITGGCPAWADGDVSASTVEKLLANAAAAQLAGAVAEPAPRPRLLQSRSPVHSSPPPPASASAGGSSRAPSNKLRPRSDAAPSLPGGPAGKFRRSRRARVVQVQNPTTWESLRIAGSATPFLVAMMLFLPWISGAFFPEAGRLNGYRTFAELADLAPYRRILIGSLALGSLGIGCFSLKGALDGGNEMPGATFASAAVAVVSLLILAWALPPESRSVHHLGGACATFTPLLLGAAFGILPGRDNTPTGSLISWITAGCLAATALILFLVGASMGF